MTEKDKKMDLKPGEEEREREKSEKDDGEGDKNKKMLKKKSNKES